MIKNKSLKDRFNSSLPYLGTGSYGAYLAFNKMKGIEADAFAQAVDESVADLKRKVRVTHANSPTLLSESVMRGLIEEHYPGLKGSDIFSKVIIKYLPQEGVFVFEPTREYLTSFMDSRKGIEALKSTLSAAKIPMLISATAMMGITGIYIKVAPVLKDKIDKLRGAERLDAIASIMKEELEKRAYYVSVEDAAIKNRNVVKILSKYIR